MDKTELILHPIRMRLILSLVGQAKTAQTLRDTLTDIPQATLYRHLKLLADGGIITVLETRKVGKTVEKVYTVSTDVANLTAKDLAKATRDDHLRYFMTCMAALLDQFERYLQRDEIDLQADMVGYRTTPLYLSDAELQTLLEQINQLLIPVLQNQPTPERRRRLLSTLLIPDD